MAFSDPEKLAKAWATAPSIHAYSVEKAGQKWRESTPGWRLPETHQLFSAEAAFRDREFLKRLAAARDETRRELIAGRIVGLGRPTDANIIERVSDLFWVGAEIDWAGGTVTRDGKTISEICVVPAVALTPAMPAASSTVGRPSRAAVIGEAIDVYAKDDPGLAKPRSGRFRAYRAYISAHGYDPRTDHGFSEKTFEKYEREYRTKNK